MHVTATFSHDLRSKCADLSELLLRMNNYPKRILSLQQQAQSYVDAGMAISSIDDVINALKSIGYYRLRGYCFPLYDNDNKKYIPGTEFQDVLKIYEIPLWATVEVLSFGTLSKIVKNLKTGKGSAYEKLADNYTYRSKRGNQVRPSLKMLSSWIHALVILRNMCAHNSRIYHRSINTMPEILEVDKITPMPSHTGLYQLILTMKYLSSSDSEWLIFLTQLEQLMVEYLPYISLTSLNFPADWKKHLFV